MPVREDHADHDGVRIRYLDNRAGPPAGDGAAPAGGLPVVFVPGLTDFADDYLAALEAWTDRRLVVVEVRGRGGSDAPAHGYSTAELAGDVEAVLEAEHLRRFHLMTFSRGTVAAVAVAVARPGRVATLAVGDYRAAEHTLPDTFADSQWKARFRGVPISRRVRRHVLEGIALDARDRELWDDVAGLGVPVLVARGDGRGGIVTDAVAEEYRQRVPGVEVVTLPGAGHDLFRPDPLAYPRAVLDHIARRAPGT